MSAARASLAACLLLATACDALPGSRAIAGEADGELADAQRFGGTAVVIAPQELGTLYPAAIRDRLTRELVNDLLLLTALTLDHRMEPVPNLVEQWAVNEDTSAITLRLRNDVRWHDGRRTTAGDLKFGYETYRRTWALDSLWGAAVVVDSFTLQVAMRPHADFAYIWAHTAALPQHLFAGLTPDEVEHSPHWAGRFVGNGPFRMTDHAPGQAWTLDANLDFPEALGGRPYLDRIVVRIIPDAQASVTELIGGRADYLLNVPVGVAQQVREGDGTRLLAHPSRSFVFLGWNLRGPKFRDVRVRHALTRALNRQAIIDGLAFGHGQLAHTNVPPFHWAYDARAGAELTHDPAAARELLAEAGWTDRDGTGTLRNAAGEPFRVALLTTPTWGDLAQVVQADLRRIGIDVQIRQLELHAVARRLEQRDFEAVLISLFTRYPIDNHWLYHCDYVDKPFQITGFCDPELDRLMDDLQRVTDRERARPLWLGFQRRLAAAQPKSFLYYEEALRGVSTRLRDVRPDVRSPWINVRHWWIHPEDRTRRDASPPDVQRRPIDP